MGMTRRELGERLTVGLGTVSAAAVIGNRHTYGEYPLTVGSHYISWRGWHFPVDALTAVGTWVAIDPEADDQCAIVSVAGGYVGRYRELAPIDTTLRPEYRARLFRLLVDPTEAEQWRRDGFAALVVAIDAVDTARPTRLVRRPVAALAGA